MASWWFIGGVGGFNFKRTKHALFVVNNYWYHNYYSYNIFVF